MKSKAMWVVLLSIDALVACASDDDSDRPGTATPTTVATTSTTSSGGGATGAGDGGAGGAGGASQDGGGSAVSGVYGTPWGADGLANLEIGKVAGRAVSYRFRTAHSGSIEAARFFLVYRELGYFAGDGGQWRIELQTDDGTPAHAPSGTALAVGHVPDPLTNVSGVEGSSFRRVALEPAAPVVSGELYHLVLTNPAPDPLNHWTSVDDLYQASPPTPMQNGASDLDLAVLWKNGENDPWVVNRNHTPIYEIYYENEDVQGLGYIDVPSHVAIDLTQDVRVAQAFTVARTRVAAFVSARVQRIGPPGVLAVQLEEADGAVVEAGQIDLASPGASEWARYEFAMPRTLMAGATYRLVLSSPASVVRIVPLQEGATYGFSGGAVFSDGRAETVINASWSGLANRSDYDWPVYFGTM